MNKEEILEKARKHHKKELDEREENIFQKSYHYSTFFMALICTLIIFIRMKLNQSYDDINAIFTMGLGVSTLYQGLKLHKTLNIILGFGWLFLSIISFYLYYCKVMG